MSPTVNTDPIMKMYSVNGELVPVSEAHLHVSDLGLLRGYAVFDYFRVVRSQPLFINDYLARFKRSVELLHLDLPVSLGELKRQIHALIEANGVPNAGMQLLLTGGYTPDGFTPAAPNLLMLERPLKLPDERIYKEGANLITHDYTRDIPEAKTTNYAVAINLLPRQRELNAVDVLYHHGGFVFETARSNIFVVRGGKVMTPGDKVLKGVTRKQVLELARRHYEVLETPLTLDEVYSADEVFITSTIKGVMPIVKIEDKVIGESVPGKVTQHLLDLFATHVDDYLAALAT